MKLAYLTGEYPRATDTFIQREVAGLRALGHEVLTCSIRRTDKAHHVGTEQVAEAAKTFHVLEKTLNPLALIRAHVAMISASPKSYWSALKLALKSGSPGLRGRLFQGVYFAEAAVLAQKLRAAEVTHLHNHIATSSASVAMLASEMSGIPFSMTVHGPDIFFHAERWRLALKVAKARFVACISHYCRSQVMISAAPADWHKLHIIHCGIEPARYKRQPKRPKGRVLFVGRLAAVKGVPLLLEAVGALRAEGVEVCLDLVGDGPDRGDLERRTKAMGLEDVVVFHGYRSQTEVSEFLAKASVFALPSFAEGLPVVLMEALASQCPAVATRIAGIPELIVHNETGLICAPGDVEALKNAIGQMFGDEAKAMAMAKRGKAAVIAEFRSGDEANRLAQLFAGYAGSTHPGLPIRVEAGL